MFASAPPRAVTPEQNSYLPSVLQSTLPERTVVPEDALQDRISQVAVPDHKSHATVPESSSQPARSDDKWPKPMPGKSPQNSERRSGNYATVYTLIQQLNFN